MTISTETIVAGPYDGNGVTEDFAFAFKVFATSDVLVKHTDAAGTDTTAVLNTDYTVALNADQDNNPGGTITWQEAGVPAPLPVDEKVTITSQVPNTQGTALPSGGSYAAKTVERMLDKATILVKQMVRDVQRALRQPVTDVTTMGELPNAASRRGKVLAFADDADAQPIAQAVVPTSGVLATAYMETLLDDVSAALARATLELAARLYLQDKKSTDIVAAATLDLTGLATGDLIDVTGNTGITAITLDEGVEATLRFTGTPLVTHGASLVCPGNVNIQAAAGDICKVRGYAASVVRVVGYQAFEQGVLPKIVTTKGDLLVATAARTMARKAVGANNTILVADSAQAEGVKWEALAASDTVPGLIEIATPAEQETGSDVTRAVTPGRQRFHPSAAKAFVAYDMVTPAILQSYGVDSVDDDGTGQMTVHFTTPFSAAGYAVATSTGVADSGSINLALQPITTAALVGECQLIAETSAGANSDRAWASAVFYGDN